MLGSFSLENAQTQFVSGRIQHRVLSPVTPDSPQQEKGWRIFTGSLDIKDNTFSYHDENTTRTSTGIDYHHLTMEHVNISVSNFPVYQRHHSDSDQQRIARRTAGSDPQ
jgi:hypothetical protein